MSYAAFLLVLAIPTGLVVAFRRSRRRALDELDTYPTPDEETT